MLGRNFHEDEDHPHGARIAILGYGLWWTAFGGDPNILGKAVLLKREPYTVIGVLPENATTPLNTDLYTTLQPGRDGEGQATNFTAIMRLRDGATWREANAEMNRALGRSARARHFVKSSPGAQVIYYCVPLQKGLRIRSGLRCWP
jgi:macrolide transport system ATP-binding/permease protein